MSTGFRRSEAKSKEISGREEMFYLEVVRVRPCFRTELSKEKFLEQIGTRLSCFI